MAMDAPPAAADDDEGPPAGVNPARVYHALLGGRDNYSADRSLVAGLVALAPWLATGARLARVFVAHAVRAMTLAGIDQIIDVGAGLPFAPGRNVHEIAHATRPDTHVVYVDHDQMVAVYLRALTRHPLSCVVEGDIEQPDTILDDPLLTKAIKRPPVSLILRSHPHHVPSQQGRIRIPTSPRSGVTRTAAGLAITHLGAPVGDDTARTEAEHAALIHYRTGAGPLTARGRGTLTSLLDGWDLLPPGLVPIDQWHSPTSEPLKCSEASDRLEPSDHDDPAQPAHPLHRPCRTLAGLARLATPEHQ